jgi:hypothetical protein
VPYIAHLIIYSLSFPPSSHAKQAVIMEEPFTSQIQAVVKVFFMVSVVMIVTQEVVQMANLLG